MNELSTVLSGSIQVTVLVLVLGALAAFLDWVVRLMRRREFSPALCGLLHRLTLLIAAIDCFLILSYAAAHAWDARPPTLRTVPAVVSTIESGANHPVCKEKTGCIGGEGH